MKNIFRVSKEFAFITIIACVGLYAVSQTPLVLSVLAGSEVTEQGTIEVLHFDNFDENQSETTYYLKGTKGKKKLEFTKKTPDVASGSVVKVTGTEKSGTITITDPNEQIALVSDPAPASSVHKVAVIMINFQDYQKKPLGKPHIQKVTFTDKKSVSAFFQENSGGKVKLEGSLNRSGDIFGWYKLPFKASSCDISAWAQAADNAAKKDGFMASNYQHIIYYFPWGCPWSGAATAAGNPGRAWINGGYTNYAVAHELGHNFTFAHASGYKCVDNQNKPVTLSEKCSIVEYGDPFDTMGSGYFMHFNNAWKQKAGWYGNNDVKTVTSNGTYTLKPVEGTANGIKALRITHDAQSDLYLEYRQPLGFDSIISAYPEVSKGISLRLGSLGAAYRQTYLLDITPATQGTSFVDSSLQPGQTFVDPATGVSITPVSVNATQATVSVVFP